MSYWVKADRYTPPPPKPREKKRTVADMVPGEEGYIVPWACRYDDNDEVVAIDVTYPVHKKRGGTVQVRVKRTRDGYEAQFWLGGYPEFADRIRNYRVR